MLDDAIQKVGGCDVRDVMQSPSPRSSTRDGDRARNGFGVCMCDARGAASLVCNHCEIIRKEGANWGDSGRTSITIGALIGKQLTGDLAPQCTGTDTLNKGAHRSTVPARALVVLH
jgi:hypothetical protein